MPNSYLEIKDGQRTAWFASEDIYNIATAAALLNRTIDAAPSPGIAAMEQCAAGNLRPITKEEFDIATQELTSALHEGLVAQVDLADDRGTFTYWKMPQGTAYRVHSSISRLTGLYEMAYDKARHELDGDSFVEGLVHHCGWEQLHPLKEKFSTPGESLSQQGMTM